MDLDDVDDRSVPVRREHDRQTDRDLGGGDHEDEDDETLPRSSTAPYFVNMTP